MGPSQGIGSDSWSFTERWIAESLDISPLTDADRRHVLEGIRQVYRFRRVPWPDHVIWVRSPFDPEGRLLNPVVLAELRLKGPAGRAVIRRARRDRIVCGILNVLWMLGFLAGAILVRLVLFRPRVLTLIGLSAVVAVGTYARIAGSATGAGDWGRFAGLFGASLFCLLILLSLLILSLMIVDDVEEVTQGGPFSAVGVLDPVSLVPAAWWDRPVGNGAGRTAAAIDRSVREARETLDVVGLNAIRSIFTFTRAKDPCLSPGQVWALTAGLLKLKPRQRRLIEGLIATRRAAGWVGYRTIVVICEPPVQLPTEQVRSST